MARGLFTTAVFLVLAAWAGAQGPSPLSADEHRKLLQKNHALLDDLIDHGVKLADADTALQRAVEGRKAAARLSKELRTAIDGGQDADRVAEMGEHLDMLLRKGLEPTIQEARDQIPPDSDEAKRLKELYHGLIGELDGVRAAVPTAGKIGESGKVKDARGKLAAARDRLGAIGRDW